MKKIASFLSLLSLGFLLVGCGNSNNETELSYRALSDSVNEYYKDVDTSLKQDKFRTSLNKVITKDYIRKSYSEAWQVLAKADEDPYNSDNILCNYTGLSIKKNLDSGTKAWNREHTYPKSRGFDSDSMDAYSDCHHLMATANQINNARGNLDFDLVSNHPNKEIQSDNYGNKWINDVCFEPRDEVKGDVARMVFYMICRYNDSKLNLDLTNEIPSSTYYLGALDTLIKWHYEDPVSDKEIRRNDIVYSYQNNRNPFIDHPEWVNNLYNTTYATENVNKDNVLNVVNKINELKEEVNMNDKDTVNNLFTLVKSLNSQEKLYVNNYYKLTKAKSLLTYLSNNQSQTDFDIFLDFTSVSQTEGYKKNHEFSVNDHQFIASEDYVKEEYRLGTNGKSVQGSDLTTICLSGSGSYLRSKFSTTIKSITIDITASYGKNIKVYLVGVKNDTYTKLSEVTYSSGKMTLSIDSFTGEFIIAISGDNNPRIAIASIGIKTK